MSNYASRTNSNSYPLTKKISTMQFKRSFLAIFLLLPFLWTSCDDDPEPENPEELITTVLLTLSPDGAGTPVVFSFQDLDGEGGNAATITTDPLAANTTYSAAVTLLNETESPVENITEEVEEEDDEHQFFLLPSANLKLDWSYLDQDADGHPVGLLLQVVTKEASSGDLTLILRHLPDKGASGVAEGNIDNAGGETDIEVTFPVTIQ